MRRFFCLMIFSFMVFAGCASSSQTNAKVVRPQAPGESDREVVSAMEQVLGAVSGKKVDQKDLENLGQNIQKDPQAKSAVEVIKNSMTQERQAVKYCPIDGQRYSPKFVICPLHQVPLKSLTD